MTGKRYQQRGKKAELDLLRIVMIQRGLTYRQVAALAGKTPQRIANVLSGSDGSWPIRAQINRCLRRRIFQKPAKGRRPRQPKQETT
jgi:hypothetical protein